MLPWLKIEEKMLLNSLRRGEVVKKEEIKSEKSFNTRVKAHLALYNNAYSACMRRDVKLIVKSRKYIFLQISLKRGVCDKLNTKISCETCLGQIQKI